MFIRPIFEFGIAVCHIFSYSEVFIWKHQNEDAELIPTCKLSDFAKNENSTSQKKNHDIK